MFSDFLSLAEILCLLIHLSQSSKGAHSQSVCGWVCVCVRVHMWPWLLRLEIVEIRWGGQRKQDANEPALINVCLISYSALSGRGRERAEGGGAEEAVRGCWVEFMRKCRPNLWFTPFCKERGISGSPS